MKMKNKRRKTKIIVYLHYKDFTAGHPRYYYPCLCDLNFTERTRDSVLLASMNEDTIDGKTIII